MYIGQKCLQKIKGFSRLVSVNGDGVFKILAPGKVRRTALASVASHASCSIVNYRCGCACTLLPAARFAQIGARPRCQCPVIFMFGCVALIV